MINPIIMNLLYLTGRIEHANCRIEVRPKKLIAEHPTL